MVLRWMNDAPDLKAILYMGLAAFAALLIGIPLSSARNEAAFPLVSDCIPVLFGNLDTASHIGHLLTCGIGTLLILGIPGAVGVFLLVYRSR